MSWYKEDYFWRKPNKDGSHGKGDLIFNTCNRIVEVNDSSDWAFISLIYCQDLLKARKRWPDYMAHPMDVDSWFKRIINRTINKLFGRHILPFRYQGRMSRDPFIAWACAAAELNARVLVACMTLPWYIYTPSFWAWWKFIVTKEEKYLRRYRFWRKLWFKSKKDYVIRLNELREKTIKML